MEVKRVAGVLCLEGPLHITEVDALRQVFEEELAQDQPLRVDLSAVSSCDVASLQVLCALRKSASKLQRTLEIAPVSEPITLLYETVGLSHGA